MSRFNAIAGTMVVGVPAVGAPVAWDFLGYRFEAGPLIVTICAVGITRLILFLNTTGRRQIILDMAVSFLCALIAALWVQSHQLSLLPAGVTGVGVATIGLGLLSAAKSQVGAAIRTGAQAMLKALSGTGSPPS